MGNRSSTTWGSEADNPDLKKELDLQVCGEVTGDRMELRSPDWFSEEGPKAKTRPLPQPRQMDQGWPKPWRIKVRSSLEHTFERANAFWTQVLPNHTLSCREEQETPGTSEKLGMLRSFLGAHSPLSSSQQRGGGATSWRLWEVQLRLSQPQGSGLQASGNTG